jgi:RNA polymerase sigma-70 factor (ECF subfamily)
VNDAARHATERVARTSYGRLIALIAARSGDIASAEDALAEAFQTALRVWPERGVPTNPEAWLLTAARRTIGHNFRHAKVKDKSASTLALLLEEREDAAQGPMSDHRLALLFVCAHPAIDASIRTPLMLQTVLGLEAGQIASAFLTSSAAMGQRLVRAKTKIRDVGLRFEVPEPDQLAERLAAVLGAIYAAFGTGWDADPGGQSGPGLIEEALYLARLVVELLPAEPEPKGLLALMLYCQARSPARRAADGAFVPLAEQDARLWSGNMIAEAEHLLTAASASGQFGRFQAEAAIQSVHVMGRLTGEVQTGALIALYDLLAAQNPTIGSLVARAAAYGDVKGPSAGLALLNQIDAEQAQSYQAYWTCRAHLLQRAGQDAHAAYDRAIGLSSDPAVRAYLMAKQQAAARGAD